MDNLKSIFKNQHDLHLNVLPAGHEERFLSKLEKELPGSGKTKKWLLPVLGYAVAASIGIVLFLSITEVNTSMNSSETIILVSETAENIEAEVYLQAQVENRIEAIQQLDKKKVHTAELMNDIHEFDNSLNRLQSDLKQAPGDQRIVDAVLNTYIMKIEALDDIVYILQKLS